MNNIRVRFAPSPTGALHIGGVRTALYNYLLAKKYNGTFILRIEDTDRNRYVPGAEEYIMESLKWCNILPTEGPDFGGEYGPYRQSERKNLYKKYAIELVEKGHAYYAFDTADELNAMREREKEKGNHSPLYNGAIKKSMTNSTTLSKEEVQKRLDSGDPYTIRLNLPSDETVVVKDKIRGEVSFQTNDLDDRIILKGDGMPTYHLANIVDDHLMKITHVIRGEEWLPSTAHHVLMYQFFGWEATMPTFVHLPLILKPNGKGKLSKRDGDKLGMPVFPLAWKAKTPEDSFDGFKEFGFDPQAVVNFLAFLGWNPGTEQELFSLEELVDAFSLEGIGKSGARFDFDKAKWFNEQYISSKSNKELATIVKPLLEEKGYKVTDEFVESFCGMMKERVTFYKDFLDNGYYFFEPVKEYDHKTIKKKWKDDHKSNLAKMNDIILNTSPFDSTTMANNVKEFITSNELKFGDLFPLLRVAVAGIVKGPPVFDMIALLGKEEVKHRLDKATTFFENTVQQKV